jgi:hypothetical protein
MCGTPDYSNFARTIVRAGNQSARRLGGAPAKLGSPPGAELPSGRLTRCPPQQLLISRPQPLSAKESDTLPTGRREPRVAYPEKEPLT